jgi:small GTP-binding protein
MSADDSYEIKVILVGRTRVGKTCIVNAALTGAPSVDTPPTIGAGFSLKTFDWHGKRYIFQMWDTAGHERFRSMTRMYYRGASLALIVFAVNDAQSFAEIESWRESLLSSLTTVSIVLVGNKSDLAHCVSREDAELKAAEIKAKYIETSAKTGDGIDDLFAMLAKEVAENLGQMQLVRRTVAQDPVPEEKCC